MTSSKIYVNPLTGELEFIPSSILSGYVPYTGATANLDLGTYEISAGKGTFGGSSSGQSVIDKGLVINEGGTGADTTSDLRVETISYSSAFVIDASADTAEFTVPLIGITPTTDYHLATKKYVDDNIPSLTGYVPYTGATANLNLGAYDLYADLLYINDAIFTGDIYLNDLKKIDFDSGNATLYYSSGSNKIILNGDVGILGDTSVVGDLSATGDITGNNLSGTNTGDQDLTGYVPYNGATTDVDLGTHNITANNLNVSNWDTAYSWGDHSTEGYLKNIVEDTSPQLGANLDGQSYNITTTGTGIFTGITDNNLTASLGVYTDSNKKFTSTPPTTGTLGYWSRTGTVLSPANSGDDLSFTGYIGRINTPASDYCIDIVGDSTRKNIIIKSGEKGQLHLESGNGPDVDAGGSAWVFGSPAGNMYVEAGDGANVTNIGGSCWGGSGGGFQMTGGEGGSVELSGSYTGTPGSGGDLYIFGGAGGGFTGSTTGNAKGGTGGSLWFYAGDGGDGMGTTPQAGAGGDFYIIGGAEGSGANGIGGDIELRCGHGTTKGNVVIRPAAIGEIARFIGDDLSLNFPDTNKLVFGDGKDATIYYDSVNMIIDPKEVGAGILDVLGTLQTDGYNSSDGTAGASSTTGGLTFKNGLYTSGSASTVNKTTVVVTTTYTVAVDVVFCDTDSAGFTVTMPTGADGKTITIINTGSSNNDVTVTSTDNLQGSSDDITLIDGESITLVYNPTEKWWCI